MGAGEGLNPNEACLLNPLKEKSLSGSRSVRFHGSVDRRVTGVCSLVNLYKTVVPYLPGVSGRPKLGLRHLPNFGIPSKRVPAITM